MKNSYFITGGSGFLGRSIAINLAKDKNNLIKIFDNNYRGYKDLNIIRKKNIKYIKGDVRNYNSIKKKLSKKDIVIHLAFINGTKFFYSKPHEVLEIGIKGLMNVVDACKEKKIKKLILASSSEVYNEPIDIPTPEEEPIKIPNIHNPRFSYSGGKILTELVGINYGRKYFKKLIIFRPHNVYGPNMGNEHVIPELIKKIKKSKTNVKIQGTGKEVRSFIYIDDFCDAFNSILKKGKHLEIYNIGNSNPISINNLVKLLKRLMKKENIKIIKSKRSGGSSLNRCPKISKIKKLGYKQKISLEKGIKKTIEWYI
tara:strand:- start:2612 stop:3550 length:939 start_codon:yes stop_codon:yes gene_type:complete